MGGLKVEWIRAPNSSSGDSVQQSVGSRAMTLVSLNLSMITGTCFSPPRVKWVPVRAEMVLVIDLTKYFVAQGCILPQGAEMV